MASGQTVPFESETGSLSRDQMVRMEMMLRRQALKENEHLLAGAEIREEGVSALGVIWRGPDEAVNEWSTQASSRHCPEPTPRSPFVQATWRPKIVSESESRTVTSGNESGIASGGLCMLAGPRNRS